MLRTRTRRLPLVLFVIGSSSLLCQGFIVPGPVTLLASSSSARASCTSFGRTIPAKALRMTATSTEAGSSGTQEGFGNILILDHVNINHEKGRHDVLKAFYYDVLGCAVDPRKIENIEKGKKTLWANAGINQLHLPEEDSAQVLAGKMILEYSSIENVAKRLASPPAVLQGTKFAWKARSDGGLDVTCPWGNTFELRPNGVRDERGVQPGEESEPLGMPEVHIDVPPDGSMGGIARFYRDLVGAHVQEEGGGGVVRVQCGPRQELVFTRREEGHAVRHSDYHISMYVSDFSGMFRRMEQRGLIFVNPRFKRRARTLPEAQAQCMFRVRDLIDPGSAEALPSLVLEHEIRSPLNVDGTPYKSCPFRT